MSSLEPKQLKRLFITIEVNALLWLAVCGAIWSSRSVEPNVKYLATAGMILAALLQHWAYYNIYRSTKSAQRS